MSKKYIWISAFVLAAVLFKLLIFPFGLPKKNEEGYPLTKISAKILDVESALLSKRHKMKCVSLGRSTLKKLDHLSWHFSVPHKLTKDEGRALVVDCVNQVIKHVNTNEEVRPYFMEERFNEKNIEIAIFCQDKEGVFYPDIDTFSFRHGEIQYLTQDPNDAEGPYYSREAESYDEAISLLKKQKRESVLLESQL